MAAGASPGSARRGVPKDALAQAPWGWRPAPERE